MMKTIAVAGAALFVLASAANALTLTNRDATPVKITVIEGDNSAEHVVEPSMQLDGICAAGCVIRLNDNADDEYELDGSEVVSIEEGSLYYDGPDVPADQGSGDEGSQINN